MDTPFCDLPDSPRLLPGMEEALGSELLLDEDEQRARFTGKIVERNRERVDGILQCTAANMPARAICRAFHLSPHSLVTLRDRHGVKLAALKQGIARRMAMFAELGIDRLISEVDSMDVDRLAIAVGIITDKLQVLTGEATVIVGAVGDGPKHFSIDDLRSRLAAAKNVTPTGSDAQEIEQTREAPALPIAPATVDLGSLVDNQSVKTP